MIIKRGQLRVDFYDTPKKYVESCVSGTRDFILPAIGKLSFVVLEDVEMIKVELYAYLSYADKYFFSDITMSKQLSFR